MKEKHKLNSLQIFQEKFLVHDKWNTLYSNFLCFEKLKLKVVIFFLTSDQ